MTVRTRAELNSDADTYLPDNTTGDISPADVRQRFKDMADSALLSGDPLGGGENVCNGRLTLESGVGVSTTDQTAKTTLYFTPWKGNKVGVYISSAWVVKTLTEVSLSLSLYTTGKPYDIFLYDNAGTLTLESLVWTNDTTRATAIALQDGIPVKSGDATRRYLGTIYTSATGQCEDSLAKRYVWNCYNRVRRAMRRLEATNSWTYSPINPTIRQANNSASNRLDFVIGLSEDLVEAFLQVAYLGTGTDARNYAFLALDSTAGMTSGVTAIGGKVGAGFGVITSRFCDAVAVGRHVINWLEQGNDGSGSDSSTYYGDNGASLEQGGITGHIAA